MYLLAAGAAGCATVVKTEQMFFSCEIAFSCCSPFGHTELLLLMVALQIISVETFF